MLTGVSVSLPPFGSRRRPLAGPSDPVRKHDDPLENPANHPLQSAPPIRPICGMSKHAWRTPAHESVQPREPCPPLSPHLPLPFRSTRKTPAGRADRGLKYCDPQKRRDLMSPLGDHWVISRSRSARSRPSRRGHSRRLLRPRASSRGRCPWRSSLPSGRWPSRRS